MTTASTCTRRAMTAAERADLVAWRDKVQGFRRRHVGSGVLLWALQMLVFWAGWSALVWLVRRALGVEIDWDARAVLAAGATVCAFWATLATRRNLRRSVDHLARLDADLAAGVVDDESLALTAAKPFVEPEHGNRFFAVRTDDDRVYVLFEEQDPDADLGDDEAIPKTNLRIVRAPLSRHLVRQVFSGAPLPLDAPQEMLAPLEQWPELDAFCAVPWDALDERFGEGGARP